MMNVQELKSPYSDPFDPRYVCLGIESTTLHCFPAVSELLTLQHIDMRLTDVRHA